MPADPTDRTIGFVGAGRVGSALARAMAQHGCRITAVSSRRLSAAQDLAGSLPTARGVASAQAVADAADVLFLTVPDDALASVAAEVRWRPGQLALHCSGALDLAPLQPALNAGASVGSFHPLQTFSDPAVPPDVRFRGISIAVEGTDPVCAWLEQLAQHLGARSLRLAAADRALYHASAVLAAGCVVSLFNQACQLWQQFGATPAEGQAALLPLLRGVVHTLEQLPPAQALSGPVARGDVGTVQRHINALASSAPDTLSVYRELSRLAIPLALARGSLSPARAEQLEQHLVGAIAAAPGAGLATFREGDPCA